MKFNTVAEAWYFWEYYGGRMSFSVRKRYTNTSKFDGVVTSCKFVCYKEGKEGTDKRDS
jgi:zinc finger SWIM domain-containing protein 3